MKEARGPGADKNATKEEEEEEEEAAPSLFPLSSISEPPIQTTSHDPQWLCNRSFAANVSLPPNSTAPHYDPILEEEEEEEDAEKFPSVNPPPSYDLLDSSKSDSGADRGKRRRKKKKRKRKRFHDVGGEDASRKSAVRDWAGSDAKPAKDCYFDTHGDRDNLAFGSLYRMDVARYRLHNGASGLRLQFLNHWKQWGALFGTDGDVDALDSKLRVKGRYCSTNYSTLERHKDFKHVRVTAIEKSSAISVDFIPLTELQPYKSGNSGFLAQGELEESWEDEVLRRTREFNKMSRESPHDEKVWLAFADFQDIIARRQPQKAARLQMLEKKISILENAIELNPDNEELLLCLLKTYQRRDSPRVLMERWERILMQNSGSLKLWKEFLHVRQGEFSMFKVSDTRKIYTHAIHALSAARGKLHRQVNQTAKPQSDRDLIQLECGLVDIFVSLCRFEWQAGYQEVATGLFQAEIEYSLFCPSLLLTEQSKQRLFEHFWNGNSARIGEDGALGWSVWLEKEEENRQKVITDDYSSQETEVGGWTGWSEPLSRSNDINELPEILAEDAVGDGDIEEKVDTANFEQEEDVESLLKKLGIINVDAEADTEVKDTSTWNRWSEEESARDCEQWMPVREHHGSPQTDDTPDREADDQLSRVILFEDVSEYLFSLCSEEARFCLVAQFIDFFGGKLFRRPCTNSPSWIESTLSLETLQGSILEDLREVHELVARKQSVSSSFNLEFLSGGSVDVSRRTNMMKFLRNAILLCLNAFPRNYILEEAVLVAEDLFTTKMNSRVLAKRLLKNDRQDLLLCGIYARSEAASGNIDLARKIFDMALSSIEGLPLDLQANAAILYFWYAEMELANYNSDSSLESSPLRAIHILSCLGSSVKYTAFKGQASSLQLLRARQGFKEQIKSLHSRWAQGVIKDQSIALICSAALFEELTIGWEAGIAILKEAFHMALPERRSQSSELESLFNHYIKMLQKHFKKLKLSRAWAEILHGLQLYPYSPKLFAAFIEVSCLYTVPNKVRQVFDGYCHKKPSVIVWLFALSFELGKAGSEHRIHGIFERALANDSLQKSVILWRSYLAYEVHLTCNFAAAKRIFFRAIHACPWSKKLWLDGFQKLNAILTAKELSDLQEVMRDKEIHLRTDIYEILLQDDIET